MAIDLSKLEAPQVIESLSYEVILAENIAQLQQIIPDWQALESDVYMPLLEAFSYRELMLRQRINNAAKAVLLPHATAADLDNLAAFFGLERKLIVAGDAAANPPTFDVFESDAVFRARVVLANYQFSTAGSIDSYVFHAFNADTNVKDAFISSPLPGQVEVVILSHVADGLPDANLLASVQVNLSQDKVRPLTDQVSVVAATIVPFSLNATLYYYGNQSFAMVKALAESRLQTYFGDMHKLGYNIHASAIHAALQVDGVQRVDLGTFADVVIAPHQAAWCTAYTLADGGFDV